MKRLAVLMVLLLAGVLAISAAPKFKIGLVFDVGGRGDNSFNDSAYNGLVALAKAYKGWIQDDPSKVNFGTDVQIKYLEPKAGGQDREILMRALAEDGYQMIYGIGFLFSDALAKVAKDFPDIHFGLIDGYIPDLTDSSNITCLTFKENEGSFLVGAIAALKAKGKPIGFLGGMDIPLIHRFQNGFDAGAMYVDKAYRQANMIMDQYAGKDPTAFNDPTTGYNISSNFYKQGADVVFHASGGTGVGLFKAAQEAKKTAIGVDSDQGLIWASSKDAATKAQARYILTSMIKRVDNAVFLSSKDFIDNGAKLAGGYRTFGLKENGVGFAQNQFNKAGLADVVKKIDQLRADIISGKITVPDENTDMAAYTKGLM
ncbi:MAG: BMP family lipoprotein [Spirochaetia bacterium]